MSRDNFVRWTCNACGATEETKADAQPLNWVGYGFSDTGKPLGEQTTLGHLCADCGDRVRRALVMPIPPTVRPLPEVACLVDHGIDPCPGYPHPQRNSRDDA